MTTISPAHLGDEFCQRFGVEVPIVGAPMAFVAGGRLAASVADAGGLGLIGGGYGDEDWITDQLALAGTDHVRSGRVGVGLITWRLADLGLGLVERLISRGVRTICCSFGDPRPIMALVHGAGGRVLCQVQSVDEALRAAAGGADAIVVQGTEAGGHGRHNEGVEALVRATVGAIAGTGSPVLAAGGITTVDRVRRALGWGAAGVMIGTRLYATTEALDVEAAKQLLVASDGGDTVRTSVFDRVRGPDWPEGYDGRALRNTLVTQWERSSSEILDDLDRAQAGYRIATDAADLSQRVVWAGSGVGEIQSIAPAATVIAELTAGFGR
ncbi:MAG: nitronate monooxygenase [Actinomycetota bacterium]|nr:nitronate monooxygenase [Actinomycetota bacterium]